MAHHQPRFAAPRRRRWNLTPDQFTLLLGRMYNRQKKAQGGDRKSEESKAQNEQLISTADKLASEYGVSRETVKRAGKVAEMFAALPDDKKESVFSGDKRLTEIKREIKEEKKEDRRDGVKRLRQRRETSVLQRGSRGRFHAFGALSDTAALAMARGLRFILQAP